MSKNIIRVFAAFFVVLAIIVLALVIMSVINPAGSHRQYDNENFSMEVPSNYYATSENILKKLSTPDYEVIGEFSDNSRSESNFDSLYFKDGMITVYRYNNFADDNSAISQAYCDEFLNNIKSSYGSRIRQDSTSVLEQKDDKNYCQIDYIVSTSEEDLKDNYRLANLSYFTSRYYLYGKTLVVSEVQYLRPASKDIFETSLDSFKYNK